MAPATSLGLLLARHDDGGSASTLNSTMAGSQQNQALNANVPFGVAMACLAMCLVLVAFWCCMKIYNKRQKFESQIEARDQIIRNMSRQAHQDASWAAEREELIEILQELERKNKEKIAQLKRRLEQRCRACGFVRGLSDDEEEEEEEERRRREQQQRSQPQPGSSRSHARSSDVSPRTWSSRRRGVDEERYWQAGNTSRSSSLPPVEEGHHWQAGTTPAPRSDNAGSYDDDDISVGIASSVGVSRPVAKATAVTSTSTRPGKHGRVLTGKPVLQVVNAEVSEISPRAAHLVVGDESDEGEPADIPLRRMPGRAY